jgi:hypothetical protein
VTSGDVDGINMYKDENGSLLNGTGREHAAAATDRRTRPAGDAAW